MATGKRIIVVGAGVKGLFVCRELCRLGYQVNIMERSTSVGGKIRTARSPTSSHNAYSEMGAMRILDSHKHTMTLLNDLKLRVIPFIEDNENAPFVIKDQRGTIKDLNLGTLIDSGLVEKEVLQSDNRLSRNTPFSQILQIAFADAMEVISKQNNDGPMTIAKFLSIPGEGTTARRCAAVVLELKFGKEGVHNVGSVQEFVKFMKLHSGKPFTVDGGCDNIIKNLLKELTEESITLNMQTEVISVNYTMENSVTVSYKKIGVEKIQSLQADVVLLACPSLHKIQFTPNLPALYTEMIHQKLYNGCSPAMKSVLRFDDCFWQNNTHGGLIGGTCWIGPSAMNQIILPPFYSKGEGYLMVYLLGESINQWLEYSVDERINEALKAIEKLFPSIEGTLKQHFQDMTEVVWNEAGSGAYFVVNAEYVRDTLKSLNRIVFSPVPRAWIEDALIDGEMAVNQIQNIFSSL